MSNVHHSNPFSVSTDGVQASSLWCSGNTNNGAGISSGACLLKAKPAITGATLTCTSAGQTS